MKKIFDFIIGAFGCFYASAVYAADKFEILPDLPEPLATAQAASVANTASDTAVVSHTIGQDPNILSVVFSLIFVILLIYATGIIYTKLNKMGMNTFKKQMGENSSSKVSVVSTTPLGGNKTLHVVELDGKRMLLGASSSSIQLLKDLGSSAVQEIETGEYSKIEIPNIRIPKIEIPKIEFPNIGFTKTFTGSKNNEDKVEQETDDETVITDIYEEGSDGIIDKLFQQEEPIINEEPETEHKVDPDEYVLYKKYL